MLVHDHDRGLRLRREGSLFCHDLASVCQDGLFISVHISLGCFLAVKQKRKIRTLILLKISFKHFITVAFFFSIGMLDSQRIIQKDLSPGWEIGRILVFFVTDLLNDRILCGVDP